jgi:16S rRNA (uracil1498-N3)-methyltransferase
MYQFFVEPEQIKEHTVTILGSDVNHIKNVLRMKPGDELSVSNGMDGREYRCGILSLNPDRIECELRFIKEDSHELPSGIFLFQGLPKGDKMEEIVQKNVELGVRAVIPVRMKRCVVKLDEKKALQKTERWQGIAEAAAKQSRRGIIPEIHIPLSFKEAVDLAKRQCDLILLPYELAENMEETRRVFGRVESGKQIAVFIGPEGGFDPDEVKTLKEAGAVSITLGKRILRTETAGMTVMSVLMYLLEE